MISQKVYYVLDKNYSKVSSWAIWTPPNADKPKSNTDDMTLFQNIPALCKMLNPKYVFIGLNAANHGAQNVIPWSGFHSGYQHQNDYKIRYALMFTRFWGSYITDVIKDYPETDSRKVKNYIDNHPNVRDANLKRLEEELSVFPRKPILVAMGDDAYDLLQPLSGNYKIYKIPHYSKRIGKDAYRNEVQASLSGI